jgi:protein-tyrosine kinase
MSKIEKALRKARSGGALRIVVSEEAVTNPAATESASSTGEGRSLVATPAVSQTDLEDRANAALAIARMREPDVRDRGDLEAGRIIYPDMADNEVVQAFRQIRTRVIQKTAGRNAVIMVTSVKGNGGSSFVAMNLGVAFAFDAGKTALIVDCNLRRPGFNRLLMKEGCRGLTDYLEHPELGVGDILHAVGVERLRVIPAGSQREIPAEYFTSVKMRSFVDALKQRYRERYIIIDAPPMTESADTQILAELCDLVLLVVPYGAATKEEVDACVKAIDRSKFFGTVFNGEPRVPDIGWGSLVRGMAGDVLVKSGELWNAAIQAYRRLRHK